MAAPMLPQFPDLQLVAVPVGMPWGLGMPWSV